MGEGVEEQNLFLLPGSGTASPKCLVRDPEGQKEGLQLNADKLCQQQRLLGVKACCLHSWGYSPWCAVEASTTPRSPLTRTKRKTVSN